MVKKRKIAAPRIGIGLRAILDFPEKEEQRVVKQLTDILEKSRAE